MLLAQIGRQSVGLADGALLLYTLIAHSERQGPRPNLFMLMISRSAGDEFLDFTCPVGVLHCLVGVCFGKPGSERSHGGRAAERRSGKRGSAAAGFIMEITPFALLILRPSSSTTCQTLARSGT